MTTVIDPLGSPTLVFNRSGTGIVMVDGNSYSGPAPIGNDGAPIPRVSGVTVAVLRNMALPAAGYIYRLPDDAEVGDVIELYNDRSPTLPGEYPNTVFPAIGESISVRAVSTGTNVSSVAAISIPFGRGARLRKATSTAWYSVGDI